MPRISVILPTFNRAQSLQRAIESVLNQSYRDFELIVVDDGSTDETAQVISDFESANVVAIASDSNRGVSWARNRGLDRARGDIVCFIDSDDAYLPGKLGYVAEHFEKRPEIDLFVDLYERRNNSSDQAKPRRHCNPVVEDFAFFRSALLQGRLSTATPAINVRRQVLLDVGYFDELLTEAEDLDILLRISTRHRCTATNKILWVKYASADSISANLTIYVDALIAICERHPEFRDHFTEQCEARRHFQQHFLKLVRGANGGC